MAHQGPVNGPVNGLEIACEWPRFTAKHLRRGALESDRVGPPQHVAVVHCRKRQHRRHIVTRDLDLAEAGRQIGQRVAGEGGAGGGRGGCSWLGERIGPAGLPLLRRDTWGLCHEMD
eukprot:scaffold3834_cov112-Isochrysis_galbana.AAC.1